MECLLNFAFVFTELQITEGHSHNMLSKKFVFSIIQTLGTYCQSVQGYMENICYRQVQQKITISIYICVCVCVCVYSLHRGIFGIRLCCYFHTVSYSGDMHRWFLVCIMPLGYCTWGIFFSLSQYCSNIQLLKFDFFITTCRTVIYWIWLIFGIRWMDSYCNKCLIVCLADPLNW